ncbi:D-serine deaminase-like pyridoxal phosphate-dependent protein [Nitrobacteraceae bacterium AZCC 2146]
MLQELRDLTSAMPERIENLDTPCLLLDRGRLDANVDRLRKRLSDFGVGFRPHLKTAKSVEVAMRVMPTALGPATVSTLKEAEVFACAGVTDLIYAVGIAPSKLDRVVRLRRAGVDIAVVLDSPEQARALCDASRAANIRIPALIEIDCDGHRSGLLPDDQRNLIVIGRILNEGAELRGVLTHAGDSYGARGIAEFEAHAERERAAAVAAAEILRAAALPCGVVSVGSTPTALYGRDYSGVTEVRAGVFMFFDLVQAGVGDCTIDNIALSVLSTVIGHQNDRGWTIIDAGWMAMSRDRGTAGQTVDQGYGVVCDLEGRPYPDHIVIQANQEHGIIARRPGSVAATPNLPVGAKVRILPNHACATAAQHEGYALIQEGSNLVHGYWPRFGGW